MTELEHQLALLQETVLGFAEKCNNPVSLTVSHLCKKYMAFNLEIEGSFYHHVCICCDQWLLVNEISRVRKSLESQYTAYLHLMFSHEFITQFQKKQVGGVMPCDQVLLPPAQPAKNSYRGQFFSLFCFAFPHQTIAKFYLI